MKINIKCPKCNHEFNIEHLLPKNEISEEQKKQLFEEGKQQGLSDGEIGRAKDRENYTNALNKALESQKQSTVADKGKIAEKILENFLKWEL